MPGARTSDELVPAEARRERIAALVADQGFVRVADISVLLGVSEVTVRADLAALERAGALRRVHGGAMPGRAAPREASVESTSGAHAEAKQAIARRVAELVPSGSSVMIDVGSTTLAVAKALAERADLSELTVITNGLAIALALEPAIPRFTVVVTGGTLRPLQHSLVDPLAGTALAGLHADLAIVGCNGVDADGRVSNVNLPEAEVKRTMLAASASRMLVADGSKAGQRHLGLVADLADFDVLVSAGPGSSELRSLALAVAAGVRVELAAEESGLG